MDRPVRRRRLFAASFMVALAIAPPAAAESGASDEDDEDEVTETLQKPKTEIAALPILAGNSDIGVQVGGAAFMTHLADGLRPYAWKTDLLLSLSLKPGPDGGVDLAQQAHDLRLDIPRFLGSRVRLMPGFFVERHVNAGYFGLGNGTVAVPFPDGTVGRRYHSITEEVRFRLNARFPLHGPFDAMLGLQLRYTDADAYAQSKLAADADVIENGRPRIFGLDPIASAIPAAGIVYDTRDDEISPRSGAFDIVGVRTGLGVPAGPGRSNRGMHYVGGSIVLRRYVPLVGPLVLATRFVGDVIAGNAPFYDLVQGVTFTPIDLIGGHGGLRGVPNGRYTGKIKVLGSVEVRSQLVTFGLLGQRFRLGAQAFGDVGRVWSDFKVDPERDGRGLGLKYGVGGGLYFIWGTAAVIRMEVAYSPDAVAANPGLPIGVYIADGHAF